MVRTWSICHCSHIRIVHEYDGADGLYLIHIVLFTLTVLFMYMILFTYTVLFINTMEPVVVLERNNGLCCSGDLYNKGDLWMSRKVLSKRHRAWGVWVHYESRCIFHANIHKIDCFSPVWMVVKMVEKDEWMVHPTIMEVFRTSVQSKENSKGETSYLVM